MADHPPIFGEARFTRDARAIRIEIEFDTLNFCAYEIVARDAHSNTPVLHETGDNETAQDDIYTLPGAPMLMNGRRVLLYVDVMDQSGDLGRYAIALRFFQGPVELADSPFRVEFAAMDKPFITEVFNIRLREAS